jgi:hypothetical protein
MDALLAGKDQQLEAARCRRLAQKRVVALENCNVFVLI